MRSPNNGRRTPRGRQNRRPSQPMRNTVYDSNGPDVRVRGNAGQICEKYLALARDAASAGDMVKMEACYQFAEHYQRILNSLKTDRENQQGQQNQRSENPRPENQRQENQRPENQRHSGRDNREGNDNRGNRDNNRGRNNDRNQTNDKAADNAEIAVVPVEVTPRNQPVNADGEMQPVVTTSTIDLSETEQPSVEMEVAAITAALPVQADGTESKPAPAEKKKPVRRAKPKTDSDTDEAKAAKPTPKPRARRAPAKPAAAPAATPTIAKTEETKSGDAKAAPFEDSPLPGFLGGD